MAHRFIVAGKRYALPHAEEHIAWGTAWACTPLGRDRPSAWFLAFGRWVTARIVVLGLNRGLDDQPMTGLPGILMMHVPTSPNADEGPGRVE